MAEKEALSCSVLWSVLEAVVVSWFWGLKRFWTWGPVGVSRGAEGAFVGTDSLRETTWVLRGPKM